MYPSTIRTKLATGGAVLSTSMFSREPNVAHTIYSTVRPDWVWIDQEHSPWGTESSWPICVQGRILGVSPVIRVPWNDPGDIKKAYDAGAVGVMVPQVDNPEEAADAIRYAKYPPMGERGIAPWFASMLGISQDDVLKHANNETLLIIQMESTEAYEKLDDTLALEGFEVLLVGPTDLSATLGIPGQIHHDRVEQIMSDVAQRIEGTGKFLATTFQDPAVARRWIAEGYTMMNISSPLALGCGPMVKLFAEIREEFPCE